MGGVEGDDGRALHGAGWSQGDPHLQQRSGRHSKPYPGEALGRVAASRVELWDGMGTRVSVHWLRIASMFRVSILNPLLKNY